MPLLALSLSGCEGCDYSGYTAMRVLLVSDAANPPALLQDGGTKGCIVYTDIPVDTKDPDQYGPQLQHIGQSVYDCLRGNVAATVCAGPSMTATELAPVTLT